MGIQSSHQLGKLMTRSLVRQRPCPDPGTASRCPLQPALTYGHRWPAMVESQKFKSLNEIGKREGVDASYVSRMST
jgi:hypothetical protein